MATADAVGASTVGTFLTLLSVSSLLTTRACFQLGCDADQSNFLESFTPSLQHFDQSLNHEMEFAGNIKKHAPRIEWNVSLPISEPETVAQTLCITDPALDVLICTLDGGEAKQLQKAPISGSKANGTFGIDARNGLQLWGSDTFESSSAYPLVDIDSGGLVFATDGSFYTGFETDGRSIGEPVFVSNSSSGALALTSTENGVVMIIERAGVVSGYLTDGVVHASIQLQDTLHGSRGSFLPISTPVVLDATGDQGKNRVVFLSVFKADTQRSENTLTNLTNNGTTSSRDQALHANESSGICRVYAIDVARTIDKRFSVAWFQQLECSYSSDQGMSRVTEVPLIHDSSAGRIIFPVRRSPTDDLRLVGLDVSHPHNVSVSFDTRVSRQSATRVTSLSLANTAQSTDSTNDQRSTSNLVLCTILSSASSCNEESSEASCLSVHTFDTFSGHAQGMPTNISIGKVGTKIHAASRLMSFRTSNDSLHAVAVVESRFDHYNAQQALRPDDELNCTSWLVLVPLYHEAVSPQQTISLGSCSSTMNSIFNSQVIGVSNSSVVVANGHRLIRLSWD